MAFSIDVTDDIVRLTLTDTLTNQDLADLGREFTSVEKGFAVAPHRLTDVRPVTRLEITFSGVLKLANERLQQKFPNSFKSAIVASDVAHYGFARMFQTLNDHAQITIAIFADPAEALEWLAEPGRELPRKSWSPRANAT